MDLNTMTPEQLQVLQDMFGGNSQALNQALNEARSKALNQTLAKPLAQDIVSQASIPGRTAAQAAESFGAPVAEKAAVPAIEGAAAPIFEGATPSVLGKYASGIIPKALGLAAKAAVPASVVFPHEPIGGGEGPYTKVGSDATKTAFSQEGNPDLTVINKPSNDNFADLQDYLQNKTTFTGEFPKPEVDSGLEKLLARYEASKKPKEAPGKLPNKRPDLAAEKDVLQATKDIQKAPREDFAKGYENAQKQSKLDMIGERLNLAGQQMGAAISGANSPDTKMYDEKVKLAQQGPEQYKQKFEMQLAADKNDPNSDISKAHQEFAKFLKLPPALYEGKSAATLKELDPYITKYQQAKEAAEMRRALTQKTQEDKAETQNTKRFDTMNKLINDQVASGRSAFGIDARNVNSIQNVKALLEGQLSLNDIDNRQIYEVAKSLDRVLSQGTATITGTSHLTPDTLRARAAKALEFFTNKRQGAGGEDFLKATVDTLDREENVATERLNKTKRQLLAPYSDLRKADPEKWEAVMAQHPGLSENKAARAPGPGSSELNRRVIKKGHNKATNQTEFIYSDGSREVKEGLL